MIEKSKLKEICNTYKIDSDKLVSNNENILEYGEYYNICYVLDFLRDELNIEPKNIEKCPSILYRNVENIKSNYQFLEKEQITRYSVEGCLHILSTEPSELKRTYQYIMENYGVRYLNASTSILSVNADRINEIEKNFPEFKKKNVLQAACSRWKIEEIKEIAKVCRENKIEITGSVFKKSAEEIEKIVKVCKENKIEITGSVFHSSAEKIEKIVKVCKENGIEPTGNVFYSSAEEIKKIVKVCKENGIEITGSVFKKSAEEIEKIVKACKENGIEPTGNVFLQSAEEIGEIAKVCKENNIEITGSTFKRSAEEIEKIVKVCKENGIEITGSIFQRSLKQLQENIDYIRDNYGDEYLKTLIVTKNIKNLKTVMPYLQRKCLLDILQNNSTILSLTLDEIRERESFLKSVGESILNQDGTKFNSIFGLSKNRYIQRVEKERDKEVEL